MKRVVAVLVAVLAVCLLTGSAVQAGAKGGKMRWSHEKTGACKWAPAIKVPGAENDKKPGKYTLKITFKGGELAEFFVQGDGDTDLDLYVLDSKGKEVAKDADPPANEGGGSDLCMCRWRPQRDEEYTIVIVNFGQVHNVVTAGCN
jgi:hypothetical protein